MAKLAINGGPKLVGEKLPRVWPVVTAADEKALVRVLRKGPWCRVSGGAKEVTAFEKEFAAFQDARYGVAVNNGTVAIMLALRAGGVLPGDEVLVSPVTFIASATAILEANAVPIFVDVDPESYNIDPVAVEAAITPRTRAIVAVHYGGRMCDMDALKRIARKHKLLLVEDCAHAHGSRWRGRGAGSHGDFGAFSFQESKTLTSGEGGIVLTNKKRHAETAFAIQHIGRIAGRPFYEHQILGTNLRMTEFGGALLRSQMKRLTAQTAQRERAGKLLDKLVGQVDGVEAMTPDPRQTRRGYYFYVFKFKPEMWPCDRTRFVHAVNAEGVPLGAGYGRPISHNPLFRLNNFGPSRQPLGAMLSGKKIDYSKVDLPVSEYVAGTEQLTFLCYELLRPARVLRKYVEAIKKVRDNIDELASPRKRRGRK